MERSQFHIGLEFYTGTGRWRCTDVGSRVIVAISLEPHEIVNAFMRDGARIEAREIADDPNWFNGPPYAVAEVVFDEHALPVCSLTPLDG